MKTTLKLISLLLASLMLFSSLVACGGTELEAIDFMVAKKVLRKFESLSLDFMKDELNNFITYLDRTFGKDNMPICKEYISYLKRMN